jgi:hypothetical protein
MTLHRIGLAACAALFVTAVTSAASAQCGGCGGFAATYAPVVSYAPPLAYAAPPLAYAPPAVPLPLAITTPAPIGVQGWDTGGWGGWGGWGGSWGGGCGCGGCGCGGRGFFAYGVAPTPLYVVNQGPQFSGPGMMIPFSPYAPAAGLAAPGAYPYIGRPAYYPYGYGMRRYAYRAHHYWHYRAHRPLRARG